MRYPIISPSGRRIEFYEIMRDKASRIQWLKPFHRRPEAGRFGCMCRKDPIPLNVKVERCQTPYVIEGPTAELDYGLVCAGGTKELHAPDCKFRDGLDVGHERCVTTRLPGVREVQGTAYVRFAVDLDGLPSRDVPYTKAHGNRSTRKEQVKNQLSTHGLLTFAMHRAGMYNWPRGTKSRSYGTFRQAVIWAASSVRINGRRPLNEKLFIPEEHQTTNGAALRAMLQSDPTRRVLVLGEHIFFAKPEEQPQLPRRLLLRYMSDLALDIRGTCSHILQWRSVPGWRSVLVMAVCRLEGTRVVMDHVGVLACDQDYFPVDSLKEYKVLQNLKNGGYDVSKPLYDMLIDGFRFRPDFLVHDVRGAVLCYLEVFAMWGDEYRERMLHSMCPAGYPGQSIDGDHL